MPPAPSTEAAPTVRDHLRGVLIAAHLLAMAALCIPPPPAGGSRSSLEGDVMQQIIDEWRGSVNAVGFDISQDRATDLVFAGSTHIRELRSTLQRWPRRYARLAGTSQSWSMFAYLKRRPALLRVELEEDGAWRTLYQARSADHTWQARALDSERFRAFMNRYSSHTGRKGFLHLVEWLARRAEEDFPAATQVRVEMQELRLSPPAKTLREGQIPRGKPFWTTTVQLEPFGSAP
jgi:hypothetical protein